MRYDLLDEFSTLVPFGMGISNHNRVLEYPTAKTKTARASALASWIARLVAAFKGMKTFGRAQKA